MLIDAQLGHRFWGEAVKTATYLQNWVPTMAKQKTPFELWTGYRQSVRYLRVFGSWVHILIGKSKRNKCDPKANMS